MALSTYMALSMKETASGNTLLCAVIIFCLSFKKWSWILDVEISFKVFSGAWTQFTGEIRHVNPHLRQKV